MAIGPFEMYFILVNTFSTYTTIFPREKFLSNTLLPMDSNFMRVTIFIIILHDSFAMPVNLINSERNNTFSAVTYKDKDYSQSHVNWTTFGAPRRIDKSTDKGTSVHDIKNKPESYWFNKTIVTGTKILRVMEQLKHKYPNTLGLPMGFILRYF